MRMAVMKGLVATVGGVGAFIAAFFMVLGPLISTPSPTGVVLVAALLYPLLLAVSAVIGLLRFALGLAAAIGALVCVVVVLAWAFGSDSSGEDLIFAGVIAAPAIVQVLLCGIAMAMTRLTKRR